MEVNKLSRDSLSTSLLSTKELSEVSGIISGISGVVVPYGPERTLGRRGPTGETLGRELTPTYLETGEIITVVQWQNCFRSLKNSHFSNFITVFNKNY